MDYGSLTALTWVSEASVAKKRTAPGKPRGEQGHHGNHGRFGGSESGVHVRQPGEYLRVTCEYGGERLEGPGDPGEETVYHT